MIAYNKQQLFNLSINGMISDWEDGDILSSESIVTLKNRHIVDLYIPNFFIRITLFIFTVIAAFAIAGMGAFIILESSTHRGLISASCGVYGIAVLFVLETTYINSRKNYRSGIDDALTYVGIVFIIAAFLILSESFLMFEYIYFELILSLISLPFLIAGAIRYVDKLLTTAAFLCLFKILFEIMLHAGEFSSKLIPFAVIVFSVVIYAYVLKTKKSVDLYIWSEQLVMLEILSLFTFYLGGNYYVVRELSVSLLNLTLNTGEDIPFAFLFYVFTAIIPFIYLVRGLLRKDRIMFRTGLVIFAIAVLTFKYYFSLGHHEITLTFSGLALILVAWFTIRYLKKSRYGFTIKEQNDYSILNKDAEGLVLAETLQPQIPDNAQDVKFGGDFGGGGAGASY